MFVKINSDVSSNHLPHDQLAKQIGYKLADKLIVTETIVTIIITY